MATKKEMMKNRTEKSNKPTSAAAAAGKAIDKIEKAVKVAERTVEKSEVKKEEKKKTLPVSHRLDAETVQHLKELCSLTGKNATQWITDAIEESYKIRAKDIAAMKKLRDK